MRNEALFRKFTIFASTCALAMLTSAHTQKAKKANDIVVFTCSVCAEDEMFGDGEDYQPTLMVPVESAEKVEEEPVSEAAPEEAGDTRCSSGCRMSMIMIVSLFDPEMLAAAAIFRNLSDNSDTDNKIHRFSPVIRKRVSNHNRAHIYSDFPGYICGNRIAA